MSSFWCLEKRSSGSLKIPLDVRDQLAKLMNGHPEFSACAGTTAAFFTQSCKSPQLSRCLTAGRFGKKLVLKSVNQLDIIGRHPKSRCALRQLTVQNLRLCFTKISFHTPVGGCTVVAVGTGDINAKESASSNGRIVHDSHAVVAARRSLMRLDDTKFLCECSVM